ncbi:hypothetical protein N9B12_00795 [bacterium]|nr:hypothetical protein [bacterium]
MNATAHLKFDRDYFELQYNEWLAHRSKFKKYEIWFAMLLIVFGVGMAFAFRQQWLVGGLFACAGIYEFAMSATSKCRWVNARLSTVRDDKTVELTFDDESLTSISKNGKSTIRLNGFSGFTPGSDGFFLIPDTGVSIYVPRATIDPPDSYSSLIELLSSSIGKPETNSGG